MSTHRFELIPVGPFSLGASTRFLEGFAPAAYQGESATRLDLAFAVDHHWDPVAIRVEQDRDRLLGSVQSPHDLGTPVVEAAIRQVARILSLDVDGTGFPDVGQADPVVGRLQRRYPGLRPVCFWSPYEAAAWAVIGQRIRIVQAAAIKAHMAGDLGTRLALGSRSIDAFPAPEVLAELRAFSGLNDVKVERLRGVARAALEGRLDAGRLRSLPEAAALAELQAIPGIGPFAGELILLRGAGHPDYVPTAEPRLARAVALAYRLQDLPSAAEIANLSEAWRPYRTWVSLLLRTMLEDETHEIAGRAASPRRRGSSAAAPADVPANPSTGGTDDG